MFKSLALAGAAICALSFASAQAAPKHHVASAGQPNFTGVWKVQGFITALRTDKGALPPLRPEAKAVYEQHIADRAAGKVKDPIDACLPHGAVRLMFAPYPMMLLQANGQLDMIQEANHTTRLVYIDAPAVDPDDPKWLGDSTGHWEGKSLVVDTINNDHRTWLDKAGLPHSDDMKVREKLSLSADGKVLTDAITIDDPKTYTAPWTTVVKFNRQPGEMALAENVCTRDHRM